MENCRSYGICEGRLIEKNRISRSVEPTNINCSDISFEGYVLLFVNGILLEANGVPCMRAK